MNRRIAVRAIIVDEDGKLFCVQIKANAADQFWCLPGGGLDEGEALVDGLRREMIEETNVAPEIGALLYIQQAKFGGQEHMEFFFHVKNAADYKDFDISAASHAEEEIEKHGFIDPKNSGRLLPEFLMTKDISAHISDNGTAKIFDYLQSSVQ